MNRVPRRFSPGFTLIDVLGAILLVGVGIAAIMQFIGSSTSANRVSGQMAVATVLANNIHEYALGLDPGLPPEGTPTATTHVLQLNGRTYSPPIDGQGDPISGMNNWSQSISVIAINRGDLTASPESPVAATATNLRRLRVTVACGGKDVLSCSWVIAPSMPHP